MWPHFVLFAYIHFRINHYLAWVTGIISVKSVGVGDSGGPIGSCFILVIQRKSYRDVVEIRAFNIPKYMTKLKQLCVIAPLHVVLSSGDDICYMGLERIVTGFSNQHVLWTLIVGNWRLETKLLGTHWPNWYQWHCMEITVIVVGQRMTRKYT